MNRSEREASQLARALGFRVELGRKHWKVFKGARLVAVFPRGAGGGDRQRANYRACLMRAAREEEA